MLAASRAVTKIIEDPAKLRLAIAIIDDYKDKLMSLQSANTCSTEDENGFQDYMQKMLEMGQSAKNLLEERNSVLEALENARSHAVAHTDGSTLVNSSEPLDLKSIILQVCCGCFFSSQDADMQDSNVGDEDDDAEKEPLL